MKRSTIWIFSVILTISSVVYQRKTGPTYPEKTEISINGTDYSFRLPRSHGGEDDLLLMLPAGDPELSGKLLFRRYPGYNAWDTASFNRKDRFLVATLPHQPPAGKLQYRIILTHRDESYELGRGEPVIVRFKGHAPAAALIPHILFVFAAMLLSTVAGLFAIFRYNAYRLCGILTTCFLVAGGFIMGPVIQKYAFGSFWTGFPLGQDLTDNKVLFAFAFWIVANIGNINRERRYLTITAAVSYLVITLIPHSLLGSELDYESGQVVTGFIPDMQHLNFFLVF